MLAPEYSGRMIMDNHSGNGRAPLAVGYDQRQHLSNEGPCVEGPVNSALRLLAATASGSPRIDENRVPSAAMALDCCEITEAEQLAVIASETRRDAPAPRRPDAPIPRSPELDVPSAIRLS